MTAKPDFLVENIVKYFNTRFLCINEHYLFYLFLQKLEGKK